MANITSTKIKNGIKNDIYKTFSPRGIALIGILSAIAGVLTLLDFPVIIIAPNFYKLDFSEIPVLLGAFAMGPFAGFMIELLKVLINLILNGTVTAYVGELANFIMGLSFILPASIIYRIDHTKKGAYLGLGTGTLFLAIAGALLNAYVMLPAYATAFGIDMSVIVAMGSEIFDSVTSVFTFVLLCVVPFNLIKGLVSSFITALLYKKVSFIIKDFRDKRL